MNEKNSKKSQKNNSNTHTLHLYTSNVNKYIIQASFLSTATEDEEAIYITDDSPNHVLKQFEGLNITVTNPMNLNKLKFFNKRLRILVDGDSISLNPFVLEKKMSNLKKNGFLMCTYLLSKIDKHSLKQLLLSYDDLILTTEDKMVLSSKRFEQLNLSDITVEKFVKTHLQMVMLALLQKQPMCGTDIIKIIHKNFNVLLSPAAVYPLLQTMMKSGLLNCDYTVKKKIYKLTDVAGHKIKNMVNEQLQTNKLFIQFLGNPEVR